MSKSTPTPWRVGRRSAHDALTVIETAEDYIADCTDMIGSERDIANAAYIVKAVNSHAAMVEALHALGMVALQTDEYRRNAELREAVDNALALTLSQGEQP